MIISANDIKVKGISFVEGLLKKEKEVYVTVRGKKKFVIIDLQEYEHLKEAELDKIIRDAEEDYKKGKVIKESAEEHFNRLKI